ncbi:class II aldolase/adducin family protein [Stappia sp.]|jgi:L-fuculose-phosphate aldolase|uniref:class II aldolase/adducin family protein n=1 Tax=Stappia sp. TaxID=1870903 RepID=UPI003A9A1CF7
MAPTASAAHPDLRQAVIDTCLAMNASGLNQGTSGNVSVRVGDGYLITPSGVAYAAMTPDQIVTMAPDGSHSGNWVPSSEWRMHHDIYAAHPQAGAVVHVHSTHATAVSCLRRDIPPFHYMIAVAGGATLRCADYATFGTQALSDHMLAALAGRSACLLANHGQICFGPTLEKALWLAGEVEALCHQYTVACQTGTPVILSEAEMAEVIERFATYGKQPERKPISD